ncbi:hypothetical protein FF38_11994 [Lucilia cuprina]|uniref:Uncharacterized protein n=1 Tax=Lucilia cuprina TaxID=7375 RepID=A0A0L0CDU1_LUCCU|nr:hypothetical protein FF38_11994 [Lucilia cuprina]
MITVTVISFLVNVPVLSEQITLTQPKVSTVGSFLTIALRLAMRITPKAKVTVTTMGKPSGIAATARETDILNISVKGLPCSQPNSIITPIIRKE